MILFTSSKKEKKLGKMEIQANFKKVLFPSFSLDPLLFFSDIGPHHTYNILFTISTKITDFYKMSFLLIIIV